MSTNVTWEYDTPQVYVSREKCMDYAKVLTGASADPVKMALNASCIYMCLNTWFHLIDDIGHPYVRKFLHTYLNESCKKDLTPLFEKLESTASELLPLLDCPVDSRDDQTIRKLLLDKVSLVWPELYGTMSIEGKSWEVLIEDILLILRYPKRLTPVYAPGIERASLEKFFKVDGERLITNSLSQDNFAYPSDNFEVEHAHLIDFLGEIFCELEYPEYDVINALRRHLRNATPDGATMDTCNNIICKRLSSAAFRNDRCNIHTPYVSHMSREYVPGLVVRESIKVFTDTEVGSAHMKRIKAQRQIGLPSIIHNFLVFPGKSYVEMVTVKPKVVPKSFTEGRVIAPCPIMHYKNFRPIALALEHITLPSVSDKWHGDIDLHNQNHNCILARQGSIDGTYTTVDASGASDRIKKRVQLCVVPKIYGAFINQCEMYLMAKQGSRMTLKLCHMVATSGNPFTFINESIFYAGIVELAYRLYELFNPGVTLLRFRVYGDDVVCDSRVYQLLLELYEKFGLKINAKKTFTGTQLYRESCGGEYFNGCDITPIYFPRKPWEDNDERLMSLNNALNCFFEKRGIMRSHCMAFIRHSIKYFYPCATFLPEDLRSSGLAGEQVMYDVRKVATGTINKCDDMKVAEKHPSCDFLPKNLVPYETVLRPEYGEPSYGTSKTCVCNMLSWNDYHLWANDDAYMEFLENGPLYDDALCEQLGVSTPRLSMDRRLAPVKLRFSRR